MSPLCENNLPLLPFHPPPRHPISRFQVVALGGYKTGRGGGGGGGKSIVFPYEKRGGGAEKVSYFCLLTPHSVLNNQSFILPNFEGLVLLSPSEIKRELFNLMISISQGMDRYKVPVVGKNGKLNETIERSVLWSITCNLNKIKLIFLHATCQI